MNTAMRERLAVRHAQGITCEVQGCDYPVRNLSQCCKEHDLRNYRVGHPLGTTIRFSTIEPLVKVARRYLRDNQDHPAIHDATAWLYHLINDPRRKRVEYLTARSTPRERVDRWLDRLKNQGIHEVGVLAVIVGMFMLRDLYPRDFKSDRHFTHQLVNRVCRMVRAPRQERWGGGQPIYTYDRVTAGVKDRLGAMLQGKLSLISSQIARLLSQSILDNKDT